MRIQQSRAKSSGLVAGLAALSIVASSLAADSAPSWAYGFRDPTATNDQPAPPFVTPAVTPDPALLGLAGAKKPFTRAEIEDQFGPADWFPEDHPAMPDVVARGRRPDVVACALCHYPSGRGRPESASIAGLPASYFIDQIKRFRSDERRSADRRKPHMQSMIDVAKAMTDEEMRVTADYYGSIKFTPTIRVVETDRVPKTRISTGLFLPVAGGGTEPIGDRIIEVPENPQAVDVLRSPRVGFIAYAPKGSISKGKALVTTGGGKSPLPCSECHGADLRGLPVVPAIAGRSPSYIVRQMFDMKSGTRKGPGVDAMKPVLANLTPQDMLAIAAYVSSLQP